MQKTFVNHIAVIFIATLMQISPAVADQFALVADNAPDTTGIRKTGLYSKADSGLGKALAEYKAHVKKSAGTRNISRRQSNCGWWCPAG